MYTDVTGIILAGGKSTRMGENKSFLKLGGTTVIEKVADLMKSIFSEVIIVTNTPEDYKFLSIPIFEDIYKYKGPLAGIHSGLTASKTENNFVISCDIPLMSEEMIRFIVDFKTEKPVTVCKADGFIQQLAGRYSKIVLPLAEESLKDEAEELRVENQKHRKCKVLSLLDKVGSEIIEADKLDFYINGTFFNMNKPDDYEKILKHNWK